MKLWFAALWVYDSLTRGGRSPHPDTGAREGGTDGVITNEADPAAGRDGGPVRHRRGSGRGGAADRHQEQLGKDLFFDTNLSDPPGQACAACHGPDVGYTGPDEAINIGGAVYEGAVAGRYGNRKPPAAAYAGDSPVLHYGTEWVGGMFWDGRATGGSSAILWPSRPRARS